MADIVLAEHRGQAWLVSGEQYIDDLLANTLPKNVSIEIVACESIFRGRRLVDAELRSAEHGRRAALDDPPCDREPGAPASPGSSVFFGQWSGMLDDDARAVIRASAGYAAECGDAEVVLIAYIEVGFCADARRSGESAHWGHRGGAAEAGPRAVADRPRHARPRERPGRRSRDPADRHHHQDRLSPRRPPSPRSRAAATSATREARRGPARSRRRPASEARR